ncbi:HXXEE domain-containing protein [Tsukamurella tyrosinosolvens]|uniref:HXXEE domain-containing protein n=1 Tax=Tsukamurella tyrosinosolvens TaxID=57704 RepID=UPI000C7F6E5B|nr:HXXEE domain-containing protein [Tsukamurella tyrosinosolvens]AUN41405.1 hypothetical protein ASU32_16470 [Tsukamurella tyrosinosolvens]MEC4611669.1 HXXEE domain-containing protein [Tsukamurella tyrosinosolvens]
MTERSGAVPAAATVGLFVAWAIHDTEEWFTIGPWARERGLPVSDGLARTAIGAMGVAVGAAALDGARTGGRSAWYQSALLAYGLHGVSHLAMAARCGGYAPGVATTPITVLPFWLWASSRLAREGVRRPAAGLLPGAAAMLAGGLAGSFGVAALVQRGARGRAT